MNAEKSVGLIQRQNNSLEEVLTTIDKMQVIVKMNTKNEEESAVVEITESIKGLITSKLELNAALQGLLTNHPRILD